MIKDVIKNIIPEYDCKLPTTGEKVKFRPLLVKEEKFISQINELSETLPEKLESLTELVDSCCNYTVDSKNMPVYDFQYLLMKIRTKSISEISQLRITCPTTEEHVVANIDFEYETKNMKSIKNKKEIILNNNVKLSFRIPTVLDMIKTNSGFKNDNDIVKILPFCLTEVETESSTVNLELESYENKIELIEAMTRNNYSEIKKELEEGLYTVKIEYQTSDGVDRKVVSSDFVNFLKFYLVMLI